MSRNRTPKLFVANISSRVSKSELEEKFDRYGKVVGINVREGRDGDRFAFIEFDDIRDAEYAYDKLQGYDLGGRELRLEFSHGGRRERNNTSIKEGTHCFICNRKGHWATECPKGAQQGIKKGTCFICGETDHKMRDCPKKRDMSPRSRSRSSSRSRSRSRRRNNRDRSGERSRGYNDRRRNSRSRDREREKKRRSPSSSRGSPRGGRSRSRSRSKSGSRGQERRRPVSRSRSRS